MNKREALIRIKSGNFNNSYGFDIQLLVDTVGTVGELFKNGQISEIIRCKDCEHQGPERLNDGSGCFVCRKGHGWKPDDWFCADGKRKERR